MTAGHVVFVKRKRLVRGPGAGKNLSVIAHHCGRGLTSGTGLSGLLVTSAESARYGALLSDVPSVAIVIAVPLLEVGGAHVPLWSSAAAPGFQSVLACCVKKVYIKNFLSYLQIEV